MPAFPGTVRVAGTLSATDGAVIVTEDRLSLQAGEDNLGNWSLDTLAVAHKGQAITIAIDNEVVVFMTPDADQLVEAVEEGAKRAAETAALRNDRIKRTKRPRIGRKATAKRKIELFEEHQRSEPTPLPIGAAAEPGADPWLRQITVRAPILTPPTETNQTPSIEAQPKPTREILADELSSLALAEPTSQSAPQPRSEPTPPPPAQSDSEPKPEPEPEPRPEPRLESAPAVVDAPRPTSSVRRRLPAPRLRPSLLVAIAAVAAIVVLGVFFTEAVTIVTLGVAGVAVMVAIAGIMDQAIELRLPKQLSVTRLFGLGLALLAASTALSALT